MTKRTMNGCGLFFLMFVVLMAGLVGWGSQDIKPIPPDPVPLPAAAATETTLAADTGDLANSPAFLRSHPDYLAKVAYVITEHGFTCPVVTNYWPKEEGQYGPKYEALCGVSRDAPNPVLHYTIYPNQQIVLPCKAFGLFGGGCD